MTEPILLPSDYDATLKEVGDSLGVSPGRVGQIQ